MTFRQVLSSTVDISGRSFLWRWTVFELALVVVGIICFWILPNLPEDLVDPESMDAMLVLRSFRMLRLVRLIRVFVQVTESARACSYYSGKQVQKTAQFGLFWLLTFWLVTVYLMVFLAHFSGFGYC